MNARANGPRMMCRDALLPREHMDKVRPGTGRETGLGHVRSDLALYDVGGIRHDVVLLNIQTPATINCQHLTGDIWCIEAKIGHGRSNIFGFTRTTHYRFVQDFLLVL